MEKLLNRSFVPFPVLATGRLVLRQLAVDDDQDIFVLRSDKEINRYLDRKICKSIDDARDFINKINEHISKNDSLYWAITMGDRMIGTICLFSFSEEEGKCEIGFELLTNFQGQGIMTEAAEKVVDYAFNAIKVREIEALFHRDNQRSRNLLEKLLFRKSSAHGDLEWYCLANLDTLIL